LGVAGEVIAEGFVSKADATLQTFNDILLGDAIKEAGNAKTSADSAARAASSAGNEADKAQQKGGIVAKQAEELNRKLVAATTQLEAVDAKRAELEKSLINLAVCNAPRVISNWFFTSGPGAKSYVDSLRPMAGQTVFIDVVPDAEPRRAALNIARTLADAQWNVETPLRLLDGLEDGVSVQPSVPTLTESAKGEVQNMSPYWHASDVAEKLLDFLHSYNWQAVRGWPTDPQGKLIRDEKVLPAGAIRIQVGLYPPAVYVSPPGQKELTSAMEEMRREREKTRAESKRKREEQLATFPPEVRKRLQQADDEWEAKIKSVTSNGPCQVLNPLF
jgi:hypothetical protein